MPISSARAVSNYVYLPGGTHPIHTQSNFVMRTEPLDKKPSDSRSVVRTGRPRGESAHISRCDLDKVLLDGLNAAKNRLNSLAYLNLPEPISTGVNYITNALTNNYNKRLNNTPDHRPHGGINQRPATSSVGENSGNSRHKSRQQRESLLENLCRYRTVFLIDDSCSMSSNGLWKEARDALSGVAATAVQYAREGIDIYFLNTNTHLRHARTTREVNDLFGVVQPTGACTPIEARLEALITHHLDEFEYHRTRGLPSIKPMNLVIITDGVTDDPDSLINTILNVGSRLEEQNHPLNQIGIQFIQIGDNPEATQFLKHLDDDLVKSYRIKRDFVDTTPYKGVLSSKFLIKSLLGGINRKVDQKE